MEILITVLSMVAMALLTWGGKYLREHYLTKHKLDELTQAEWMASNFVKAAEQKFNLVADTLEQVLAPEQAEILKKERAKLNADKKAYVLDLMKRAFPTLDTNVVDGLIEGALKAYKDIKADNVSRNLLRK